METMLLNLPLEILDQIVDHAIYEPPQINAKIHSSNVSPTLLSLTMTCWTVYSHLLPRLYNTLAIRVAPLPPHIFNPFIVQYTTTLIVVPALSPCQRPPAGQRRRMYKAVARAVEHFNSLRTLYLLTKPSRAVLKLVMGHHLTSLTCGGDGLDHCTPNQWRLSSLSIQNCQPGRALNALLSAHSPTLEHLALSHSGNQKYRWFPAMRKVRTLSIVGWDSEMIRQLGVAIPFDRLETLQLIDNERTPQSAYIPLREAGGLAGLRKLSIQHGIWEASEVLELTNGLEELHLVWKARGPSDEKHLLTQAIASKCHGLKALTCTISDFFVEDGMRLGLSLEEEDLVAIAASCKELKDVRIGVKHDHLHSTIAALRYFKNLRHLHIDLWAFRHEPDESPPPDPAGQYLPSAGDTQKAVVDWALEMVKESSKTLDGISVMGYLRKTTVQSEWMKPGVPVRDVCTGELRRRLKVPIVGRGAWNDAFEPVGYSEVKGETGVLI